jgi:tRNA nucleotidyltransferase (CCA-adding enzyme)
VTFYGHEAVGAEMARSALTSLRMPPRLVEAACALIAVHLWPWETASAAGLRRLVRNLGEEGARDLLELHRADVEASTPAGWPLYAAARAALDDALAGDAPTDERSLAVDGRDVMRVLRIGAGPRVGETLHALLERVLDDPAENERTRLLLRLAERRWQ